MNYLAHLLLARHSEKAMIGALLGDFVKADVVGRFEPEVALEIRLHRAIDSYTDRHPVMVDARRRFPDGRRRYAGILLDIHFDHLLCTRWSRHCEQPLAAFIAGFYAALDRHQALLPEPVRPIAARMAAQDWLGSYAEPAGIERTVVRVSSRLSRGGQQLREGMEDLHAQADRLAADFDTFFPDLQAFAVARRVELART